MKAEIATGMSRTGSVMMPPDSRNRLPRWIGFLGAYAGAVVSVAVLPDDMLPINQALFVLDCVLITTWLAVLIARGEAGRR